eukprot:8582532-Pyramimonas_sp.AAC.1
MYTPGSRIHQDPRSCANFSAGSAKASVHRVRVPHPGTLARRERGVRRWRRRWRRAKGRVLLPPLP